jgi:hypothetical protein
VSRPDAILHLLYINVRERPPAGQGGNDMLHGKRTRILIVTLVVLIAVVGGQLDGWTWT